MQKTFAFLALVATVFADVTLHEARAPREGWSVTNQAVDLSQHIRINIGMKRQNVDMLHAFVRKVSDPESSSYGQYMTQKQLANMIAPSQEAVDVVLRWLKAADIEGRVDFHKDYIHFVAPLSKIESLLSVKFAMYKHVKGGRQVARAIEAVVVPDAVAQVAEVVTGTQGFPLPTNGPTRVKRGHFDAGMAPEVTPDVIRASYNITTTAASTKNIQAIAEFQGQYVDTTDLSKFCTQYDNGAQCKVAKFIHQNNPGQPGIESSLDIEYIMSIAKGVETWVYSYPNFDFCSDLLTWASDITASGSGTHPSVVSMSYGSQKLDFCPAASMTRLNEDVAKFGAIGITSVIASGDSGSGQYSREGYNGGKLCPSFPASINYCLAIGATTFISGSSGEEQATTQFGSGGGFSWNFKADSFAHAGVDGYFKELTAKGKTPSLQFEKTGRQSPDVSLLGQGFHVINGGQNIQVGGTSASTPTWSGIISLLNNHRFAQGKPAFGYINPWIYSVPETCFHDITVGTNAISPNTIGWAAEKGWDAATGRGTPNFPCLLSHAGSAPAPGPSPPTPPGPPAPPSPPAPTPAPPTPPSGDFQQKICTDSACTQGCQSHSFPQNTCLKDTSGGSVEAHCTSAGLVEKVYLFSATCTGMFEQTTAPVNQCFATSSGQYGENICPSSITGAAVRSLEGFQRTR